jgi:hypothetical protein
VHDDSGGGKRSEGGSVGDPDDRGEPQSHISLDEALRGWRERVVAQSRIEEGDGSGGGEGDGGGGGEFRD